jgi:hypothetical protein
MARGSQASASTSRSRQGPCWRRHGGVSDVGGEEVREMGGAGGVGEGETPEVGERVAPVGSSRAGGGAACGWMGNW